jgi:hypothetical protein
MKAKRAEDFYTGSPNQKPDEPYLLRTRLGKHILFDANRMAVWSGQRFLNLTRVERVFRLFLNGIGLPLENEGAG